MLSLEIGYRDSDCKSRVSFKGSFNCNVGMWLSNAHSDLGFKSESCPDDLLEICYFYISQKKSSLDKIFYKIVYHHIIYMCYFLVNLDDFLAWFARFFTKL